MAKWRKKNPSLAKQLSLAARRKASGFDGNIPYPKPVNCEAGCGRKAVCLDHDHSTGKFRGWLCRECNLSLGFVGDSAAGVKRLLNYLEAV